MKGLSLNPRPRRNEPNAPFWCRAMRRVLPTRLSGMESTWASRDLPVLDALVTLLEEPDAFAVQVSDIA